MYSLDLSVVLQKRTKLTFIMAFGLACVKYCLPALAKTKVRKKNCAVGIIHKMHTEPNPIWHMVQIMSTYLVPAQTQRGFGGESSQHLIHLSSPLAPLLPPCPQVW